jgi:hypothetical protein
VSAAKVSIPLPAFLYEKNGPAFKIANIENLKCQEKCVEEIPRTTENLSRFIEFDFTANLILFKIDEILGVKDEPPKAYCL